MSKLLHVLLGLLLLSTTAFSQAAYITDKLVAGLYKEAKVSDKPVKALNSGTPLEVISRENGYVKVRTSDGTIGWVESAYLTEEKPARSILLETQARISMLQKQLEQVKAKADSVSGEQDAEDLSVWQEKLAKAQGQVSQLEIQLKAARLNIKEWEDRQQSAEQENRALREQIQQVADILQVSIKPRAVSEAAPEAPAAMDVGRIFANDWIWALLVIGLIIGFVAGFYYMRHRVSKRFGSVIRL